MHGLPPVTVPALDPENPGKFTLIEVAPEVADIADHDISAKLRSLGLGLFYDVDSAEAITNIKAYLAAKENQ